MPHSMTCPRCGAAFADSHATRRYCSTSCMAGAYRERMKGAGNPNFRGGGRKTCVTCGRAFCSRNQKAAACSLACRPGPTAETRAKMSAAAKRNRAPGACGSPAKDKNHDEIKAAMIAAGHTVIDTSCLGAGFGDLLVFWPRGMVMLEIKNPRRRDARLSPCQERFHAAWSGPPGTIAVVRTPREALAATGIVLP